MTLNLSILGLYNYSHEIFKNLVVPDGVDKNILIPTLVSECSDFNLLYPDFNFMQMMIGVWSQNEQRIWAAMQESVEVEYNPIENYDRYEDITRTVEGEGTTTDSAESTRTASGSGEDIGGRTSFNSVEFRDTDHATSVQSETSTSGTSGESTSTNSGTETTTAHLHGNIGVTTAAQMLEGFRDISNFSVYDFIVDSFKRRFCIQLY